MAIVEHPDVRRLLLTSQAYVEGMRALVLETGKYIDTYSAIYTPDTEGDTDRLLSVNPATGTGTAMFDTGFELMYGLSYTGGELLGLCGGGELVLLDVDARTATLVHDFGITWWGAS